MKRKIFFASLLAILALGGAAAEKVTNTNYRGAVLNMTNYQTTDILMLSQYNDAFGTARSTAMGGAFTSLGGDMSSVFLNPAGLGMYRSSDFSFSTALSFSKLKQSRNGGKLSMNSTKNDSKFTFNNVGLAFNTYESSSTKLTSFTLGVAYNKLIDFNYSGTAGIGGGTALDTSIAGVLADQITYGYPQMEMGGIRQGYMKGRNPFSADEVSYWPGMMAYKSALVNPVGGDFGNENLTSYEVTGIIGDAIVNHVSRYESSGSVGEFAVSGGFNFNNRFYFGFGVGIQDIGYDNTLFYEEHYTNNGITDPNYRIKKLHFDQRVRYSGMGVNLKLGAIVRPVDNFRIGVALHSPTWSYVDRRYDAWMETFFDNASNDTGNLKDIEPSLAYRYRYSSPTRLMAGISYNFGSWALLSADYNRVWYNGMRSRDNFDLNQTADFNNTLKADFQAGNTYKVGIEIRPTAELSLRAGYSSYSSMLRKVEVLNSQTGLYELQDPVFDNPTPYKGYNISGGLGYRSGAWTFDLTYVFTSTKYTEYDQLFSSIEFKDTSSGSVRNQVTSSGGINMIRNNSVATLTVGVRF